MPSGELPPCSAASSSPSCCRMSSTPSWVTTPSSAPSSSTGTAPSGDRSAAASTSSWSASAATDHSRSSRRSTITSRTPAPGSAVTRRRSGTQPSRVASARPLPGDASAATTNTPSSAACGSRRAARRASAMVARSPTRRYAGRIHDAADSCGHASRPRSRAERACGSAASTAAAVGEASERVRLEPRHEPAGGLGQQQVRQPDQVAAAQLRDLGVGLGGGHPGEPERHGGGQAELQHFGQVGGRPAEGLIGGQGTVEQAHGGVSQGLRATRPGQAGASPNDRMTKGMTRLVAHRRVRAGGFRPRGPGCDRGCHRVTDSDSERPRSTPPSRSLIALTSLSTRDPRGEPCCRPRGSSSSGRRTRPC